MNNYYTDLILSTKAKNDTSTGIPPTSSEQKHTKEKKVSLNFYRILAIQKFWFGVEGGVALSHSPLLQN